MKNLIPLLTPALALVGTLVAALLGYFQWRKQNWDPNRSEKAAARRDAHEELWQRLETINLLLRKGGEDNPKLHSLIRGVNEFFLSKSLYFDDRDQVELVEYITAMEALREQVYASDDSDVQAKWELTIASWRPPEHGNDIGDALLRVNALRAKIKKRIQRVVSVV
jgi:hypothetical protein